MDITQFGGLRQPASARHHHQGTLDDIETTLTDGVTGMLGGGNPLGEDETKNVQAILVPWSNYAP